MKHQKLILLLLLIFGVYATGIVGLLRKVKNNCVLCFDKDTDNSSKNTDEKTGNEGAIDEDPIDVFVTYYNLFSSSTILSNLLLHTIVSLTYQSDILEIVAPPPES